MAESFDEIPKTFVDFLIACLFHSGSSELSKNVLQCRNVNKPKNRTLIILATLAHRGYGLC